MELFAYVLIASLSVMLASLIGVIAIWKRFGTWIEGNLRLLVSFSAGVFLVVSLVLFWEALEHSHSILSTILFFAAGIVIMQIISAFLPHFHHHHDDAVEKEGTSHTHNSSRILIADAIHNVADGLLIAVAFSVSPYLGIVTLLSIIAHELVQEMSEFFVLRHAGFSVKRALFTNFLISGSILIGSIGGLLFLNLTEFLEIPLLAFAAGSFFYVVIKDLIPHSVRSSRTHNDYTHHIVWFTVGLIAMLSIQGAIGHGHEESEHHHDEAEHHDHSELVEDHHDEHEHQNSTNTDIIGL